MANAVNIDNEQVIQALVRKIQEMIKSDKTNDFPIQISFNTFTDSHYYYNDCVVVEKDNYYFIRNLFLKIKAPADYVNVELDLGIKE